MKTRWDSLNFDKYTVYKFDNIINHISKNGTISSDFIVFMKEKKQECAVKERKEKLNKLYKNIENEKI